MKNKEQHTFPFIERLLDGVEVEWKPLGEVSCVLRGKRLTKKELNNEEIYPVFHGGIEPIGYYHEANRDAGSTMIINVGASAGTISFSPKRFWSSDGCFCFSHVPALNQKYLFYYLQSIEPSIRAKVRKAGIPTLDNKLVEKLLIPIPPIAVQEEIVDILDKFTELEAELEAELEGRKRQYEYYRNQLLSIDVLSKGKLKTDKIRIMTLGELGTFTRGSGLQKKDFTPTGVGCIHYGQIYTHYGTWTTTTLSFVSNETAHRLKHVEHGDIIITNTSENVQDVCKAVVYLGKEQIVTGGHASIFKPSKHIDGKYFAYYTQTIWFAREKRKYAKGTKVIDVSANDLAKIQIPIPPLSEQQRIVSILDKFDTLTTSISEGLPKEIELRRKQYEYYRDRLLSFKH
jgi:hypothetical protein